MAQKWTDLSSSTNVDRLFGLDNASCQLSDGTLVFCDTSNGGSTILLKYSSDHSTINTIATLDAAIQTTSNGSVAICRDSSDNIYVVSSAGNSGDMVTKGFTKGAGYTWTTNTAFIQTLLAQGSSTQLDVTWCNTGGGTGSLGHLVVIKTDTISTKAYTFDADLVLTGSSSSWLNDYTMSMTPSGTNFWSSISADGFGATSGLSFMGSGTAGTNPVTAWSVNSSGVLTLTTITSNLATNSPARGKHRVIRYAPNSWALVYNSPATAGVYRVTCYSSTAQTIAPTDSGTTTIGMNAGTLQWSAYGIQGKIWVMSTGVAPQIYRAAANIGPTAITWDSAATLDDTLSPYVSGPLIHMRAVKEPTGFIVDWQAYIETASTPTYALVGDFTTFLPPLVGQASSASTIAGALSVADSLAGRTDSVSTDAAALTDKVAILATAKSVSTVSGALVAPIPLPVVAKAASTSAVSGTLHITDVLQGGLAATSTVTDTLSDVDSMGASVQSASADSGVLIAPIPIIHDVRHVYDGVVAPTALAVDYTAWFNGLLMGSGTSFITEKWTGLMGIAPVVQYHTKAQSKHGVFYGYEVQDARTVACDFGIDGNSAADLEAKLSTLAAAMQLPNVFTSELTIPLSTAAIDSPLIIKRPGKPTRQIFCHINKFDVDDDYHLAMGMAKGSIAWYAGDPRVYDLAQSNAAVVLGGGTNSINMTVTNGGNFPTTRFMLVITGPMAGPLSIQNTSAFGSPQLKLNAVMIGTDTLVIDFFAKTIQLNGVDFYQWKRSDGTWWDLLPGDNNLIINRTSNDSAASNISASWFNAWSGMA